MVRQQHLTPESLVLVPVVDKFHAAYHDMDLIVRSLFVRLTETPVPSWCNFELLYGLPYSRLADAVNIVKEYCARCVRLAVGDVEKLSCLQMPSLKIICNKKTSMDERKNFGGDEPFATPKGRKCWYAQLHTSSSRLKLSGIKSFLKMVEYVTAGGIPVLFPHSISQKLKM